MVLCPRLPTIETLTVDCVAVQCPEKEPSQCRYLRVCSPCNNCIQQRQMSQYHALHRQISEDADDVTNSWILVERINDKLRNLQIKIDDNLPKYRELLEALDAGSTQPASSVSCPKHKSNMQVLAKSQGDLSDEFTQFVTTVLGIKRLKPVTDGQMKILKRIILSKVDYYHENMALFRQLQRQLQSVVPAASLVAIQDFVDKSAMNSCYVTVKQLIFEVLHVCEKHQLDTRLAASLVPLEQLAEWDLRSCLTDPWSDHEQTVNELLRVQLSTHRLIRRIPTCRGRDVIMSTVSDRVHSILQQILLQLAAKASDSHFQDTKDSLKNIIGDLHGRHSREASDWVVVD